MGNDKYQILWLFFLNINAKEGLDFSNLIDFGNDDNSNNNKFKGAWANILIKAESINKALDIVEPGLQELGFKVEFIDKIEKIKTLIDNKEMNKDVIKECDWLLKSDYVFKISDRIFPY